MNQPGHQLLIVYDNYTLKETVTPAWGFSCLITLPHRQILFDTGGDPSILLKNMQELDVDPQKIDAVVLSHAHGDHVGGLAAILQRQSRPLVYLPASFPTNFKQALRGTGAMVEEISGPQMIYPGVYTTGELGYSLKEQSLVIKTEAGLTIITGCAHPGIVEIVEHAARVFKEEVYLLIGGFHLMGHSPSELRKIAGSLERLKVKKIAPCHCSGDEARDFFKAYSKEKYIACAAGMVLAIPDVKE